MNLGLGIWNFLSKLVVALLAAAAAVAIWFWFQPVIMNNEQMRKKVFRLEAMIEREEADQRQLKLAIDSLMRDPKALERRARESLGYAKPGETIFRFTSTPTQR